MCRRRFARGGGRWIWAFKIDFVVVVVVVVCVCCSEDREREREKEEDMGVRFGMLVGDIGVYVCLYRRM